MELYSVTTGRGMSKQIWSGLSKEEAVSLAVRLREEAGKEAQIDRI